jgi:hypothetical protein
MSCVTEKGGIMSPNRNHNGHKVIPELPIEQKEAYKVAGRWPPPEGLVILTEERPANNVVMRLLTNLAKIVRPSQKKYVERAKQKLASQQ